MAVLCFFSLFNCDARRRTFPAKIFFAHSQIECIVFLSQQLTNCFCFRLGILFIGLSIESSCRARVDFMMTNKQNRINTCLFISFRDVDSHGCLVRKDICAQSNSIICSRFEIDQEIAIIYFYGICECLDHVLAVVWKHLSR